MTSVFCCLKLGTGSIFKFMKVLLSKFIGGEQGGSVC